MDQIPEHGEPTDGGDTGETTAVDAETSSPGTTAAPVDDTPPRPTRRRTTTRRISRDDSHEVVDETVVEEWPDAYAGGHPRPVG
jgi:hypothetical protein